MACFRSLDYMKSFHCIGPDCEDTCCSGWKINLYRSDYEKIHGLFQKEKKLHKFRDGIKRLPRDERIEENYGVLNFEASKYCALMEDGWCILHRDHGEKFLPTVCATFPRIIYDFEGGVQEMSGRLSCPEVARLCLLSKDPPRLVDDSPDDLPDIFETNPWPMEGKSFYREYLGLVATCIHKIMYLDGFDYAEKNYFVLYLAKKVEPFYYSGISKDPGDRLRRSLSRLEDAAFLGKIRKNLTNLSPDVKVQELVLGVVNARLTGDHAMRYNQLCASVLKSFSSGNEDSSLAREGQIGAGVSLSALWRAFEARRALVVRHYGVLLERYFINFSVNFWFQHLYIGDGELLTPVRKFLLYHGVLRFLFLSHPEVVALASEGRSADEAEPELNRIIVEVVQIFMKHIDANLNLIKSMLSSMDKNGVTDLNSLAGLLKV